MKIPPTDPTAQPTLLLESDPFESYPLESYPLESYPLESDPLEPDLLNLDSLDPSQLGAETYLLTAVGTQALAFPAAWISEIWVVEPTQILAVPFYAPAVIGLVNHHGQVVPLISAHEVLALRMPEASNSLTDRKLKGESGLSQGRTYGVLSAVCLNSQIASLAGICIVVDRVLHSCARQALQQAAAASHLQASPVQLFQANFIPETLWQLRQP